MHKRKIHTKIKRYFQKLFIFDNTIKRLNTYDSKAEISKRQNEIRSIKIINADFLKDLKYGSSWNMPYNYIIATRDEDEYLELIKLKIPVSLVTSVDDIQQLSLYDVVITNENIELPQVVPYKIDYPEKDFKELARMIPIINILLENIEVCKVVDKTIEDKLLTLNGFKKYLKVPKPANREDIELECEIINEQLSNALKKFSGDEILKVVCTNILDKDLQGEVQHIVNSSKFPSLFTYSIPIKLDENEVDNYVKMDSANINSDHAYQIQNDSSLKDLKSLISSLKDFVSRLDFHNGIGKYLNMGNMNFPKITTDLSIKESKNLLIKKAKPITFNLDKNNMCSFLTGANSGGKTTLLEHIIQLDYITRMGLPVNGNVSIPLLKIEYLAKNKGSISRGAFETLLNQFAKLESNTLILADEIEAVTEPGVAADIICATAEFCIKNNCYCIFATHLGKDLISRMPNKSRVDGIEAKGLDKKNNLIIDHNPVLGRLAASTPELIIKKLAQSEDDYFQFLAKKVIA